MSIHTDTVSSPKTRTRNTALTITIPMGVLVGILIGLSRLATDSEVTAMRSTGMGAATTGAGIGGATATGAGAGVTATGIGTGAATTNAMTAAVPHRMSGDIRGAPGRGSG